MKLFVTGGSGFIGSRFCAAAILAGHEVAALVRPASADRLPTGARRVYGSLPYDLPADEIRRADVIVHLAAITTSDRADQAIAVNEVGTRYLCDVAAGASTAGADAQRSAGDNSTDHHLQGPSIIFLSTQSAHSGNNSAYATTKKAAETVIRESPLPWVIIRPGLVYGPGEQGLFARMRNASRKMPVLPMLGGGKALVQPIHVDDLCAALLAIAGDFSSFQGDVLELGDPEGVSLAKFMEGVAIAENRSPKHIPVPLAPVKAGVKIAELLRLPIPVSSDNLRGLETVQRMETASALEKLGLKLRDLSQGLQESVANPGKSTGGRLPVLLIGAGKIGIVHGIQLTHGRNTKLAGIVEPNPKARALYRSMGFRAPFYNSIAEALSSETPVQAAVVATPADTHLDVARQCLDAGLHLLVEKPLSVNEADEAEWLALHQSFPAQVIHAGYMAAQFPQLFTAFRLARVHKLGHIYRANLEALQTHIMAAEPVRWEMLKARAGGGAMINFGCHVASMLFRLLGWPDTEARGFQWPIHSTEVEDALVARFSIKATQCLLVTSWSVPGFARPRNCVELVCEKGIVRVENAAVSVIQDGEVTLLNTQLDYPLPFNMAPDYTGGGFALEHESFAQAALAASEGERAPAKNGIYMPPVELPEALRLENWIRRLYGSLESRRPTPADLEEFGIHRELAEILASAGETPA